MTHTAARVMLTLMTVLVMTVSGALVIGPTPARADNTKQARKLLEKGDKFMKRGDKRVAQGRENRAVKYYERALAASLKAHELVPKVSIYYAIANAEAALGRHMDAITHYLKVIDEVESEDLKTQAQAKIDEIKQNVVTLSFTVEPEGAEVSINAELRGAAPLDRPIYLEAGEYTVTVTAEGFTPYEQTLTLEAGQEEQQEVTLEKIPVVVKKPKRQPPKRDPARSSRNQDKRVTKPGMGRIFVTGGVALGLFAGATVTGVTALSNHGTFKDDGVSDDERESARSSGKTMALLTDVFVIAGIAATAYTTYYYLKVYRPRAAAYERQERKRDDPEEWTIAPYVHGSGGGLSVSGRF